MTTSGSQERQSGIWLELFLLSFVSLFLELVAIRWLASEIRAFSIYKNFPLITCFVGLGGGFLLAYKSDRYFRFFPWLLLVLIVTIATSDATGLAFICAPGSRTPVAHVWRDLVHPPEFAIANPLAYTALSFLAFFALLSLLAITFATLGERIGRLFNEGSPLKSYTVNLVGAAAGIVCFSVLSFLCTPPALWIAVGLAPAFFSFRRDRRGICALVLCILAAGVVPLWARGSEDNSNAHHRTLWSPYHRVDIDPFIWDMRDKKAESQQLGYTITVNKAFFQQPLNLSGSFLDGLSQADDLRNFAFNLYEFPYLLLSPRRVLVMGSGTGNDVACALRHKAEHVDAVEIDPLMVKLGHELHAESPYKSPNVRAMVNDARAFLRQNDDKYDLVLTGVLDSHTVAGNSLSVRLDDYVYTADGLRDALSHVAPGGLLNISYCAVDDWLAKRILENLRLAAGSPDSVVAYKRKGTQIWHYLAPVTPALREHLRRVLPAEYEDLSAIDTSGIRASTDDWPYLYLRPMVLDPTYLAVSLAALLLSWAALGRYIRRYRSVRRWHLFSLGAGFLLVELAIVDRLALIFGTTWIVNSVAIFAVLVTVTLANLLVLRSPEKISPKLAYLFLMGFLVLLYFVPVEKFNYLGVVTGGLAAAVLSAVPIFFAGIIFSQSFSQEDTPSVGLAFNVFGSVIGGLLEYVATYTGLRSLLLIALAIYAASFFLYRRLRPSGH